MQLLENHFGKRIAVLTEKQPEMKHAVKESGDEKFELGLDRKGGFPMEMYEQHQLLKEYVEKGWIRKKGRTGFY